MIFLPVHLNEPLLLKDEYMWLKLIIFKGYTRRKILALRSRDVSYSNLRKTEFPSVEIVDSNFFLNHSEFLVHIHCDSWIDRSVRPNGQKRGSAELERFGHFHWGFSQTVRPLFYKNAKVTTRDWTDMILVDSEWH